MGLPPVRLGGRPENICSSVGRCYAGEEVLFREGERERWIRFLHPEHGYINLQDNIPIYFAANGPKAMELTGEVADGWITVFSDAEYFSRDLAVVARGAEKAGRSVEAIARMALTTTCLLQPGESPTSPACHRTGWAVRHSAPARHVGRVGGGRRAVAPGSALYALS